MAQTYRGLGVSSGVAIGRTLVIARETVPASPIPIPSETVDAEVARFKGARERARQELGELKARMRRVLGEAYAGILEAQILILDDPNLIEQTEERIRRQSVAASWALRESVHSFMVRFESVDDGYLRERGGDLDDVHRRLQRLLRSAPTGDGEVPEGPLVVVAHTLGPSDTFALARGKVVGLVTDVGGRTSHTAILAQALSLPAVVGLHDISSRLDSGEHVIVDGDAGTVQTLTEAADVARAERSREVWLAREAAMASLADLPAVTRDGVEVTLRANIELPQEVGTALRFGARGIGLYRSEFLFLTRAPRFPTEEEHYATYREMAEKIAPHPAVIRTLDLGGEKYFHEVLEQRESNPVLGLRAVRFCLRRADIFLPQIRGLLRASVHADVRVMIPLVTTIGEIRDVRALLQQEAEDLRRQGIPCRSDMPLGIMVEVPAAAAIADLLALESDFFSVGTNDLIQYALAVDRGNEQVSYLYQPLHPAVLRMLKFIVEAGASRGIPVSLCGEMAADPSLSALIVGLGFRELSVQPRALASVRDAIRSIEAAPAADLADRALAEASASGVERHLGQPKRRAGNRGRRLRSVDG